MNGKIEKLTKEQEEYLPVFRQKYLDLTCDGKRIDRDKLQSAINDAYGLIDKEPPLLIILQSPQQAMMATAFLKSVGKINDSNELDNQLEEQLRKQLWDQLDNQLGDQLREQLDNQLWDQLWNQLKRQLGEQLNGQLRDQLREQLGEQLNRQLGSQLNRQLNRQLDSQLWEQLWNQLDSQLWKQLWNQLNGQLRDQLNGQLRDQLEGQKMYDGGYLWGAHDLYWIAFYKFCNQIGVKYSKKQKEILDINFKIAEQCEWWWPYDGICFVSEKPLKVNWDGNVLHGEDKPAVLYEDGYAIYSWRGTNVPKEWIENKETITPEIALTWENVEQRRCAAEIIGWYNVLEHPSLNPKVINKDEDPQIGELIEVDLPNIGRERFLKVECGTGRTFALPCPPNVNTALDAQAWLNFCTPEDILSIEFRT